MTTTGTDQTAVTAIIVTAGTIITQFLNHRRGKKRDTTGTKVWERIEEKIDKNHDEIRRTCEVMSLRIDEIDATATEALHHAIGADGKNGNRGRIEKLELWREDEQNRERDRLERAAAGLPENRVGLPDRRLGPSDVGSLTPRSI